MAVEKVRYSTDKHFCELIEYSQEKRNIASLELHYSNIDNVDEVEPPLHFVNMEVRLRPESKNPGNLTSKNWRQRSVA